MNFVSEHINNARTGNAVVVTVEGSHCDVATSTELHDVLNASCVGEDQRALGGEGTGTRKRQHK